MQQKKYTVQHLQKVFLVFTPGWGSGSLESKRRQADRRYDLNIGLTVVRKDKSKVIDLIVSQTLLPPQTKWN